MAEIDNKHEVNDSVDMSIKTDNEVSTSLIEVSDNEVSDNPIDGLTDSVTNSLTESLTDIDWQRSEDGSYSPSSYINRDLSLLQFHLRVLAQAASSRHPLLERLFFLIIFSSNIDEFFEIRVAGIMQKLNLGDVSTSVHGMRPSEVLEEISVITHAAIAEQYRILNEDILPALAKEDIRYLKRDELNS